MARRAPGRACLRRSADDWHRALCYNLCLSEMEDGTVQVRPAGIKIRAGLAVLVSAMTIAGCNGFGGPKKQDATSNVDPNVFPANYRTQISVFLSTVLQDPNDFRGALIAQPVLKQVGDNPHYVVCIQLAGRGQRKNKVAIYLAGAITQFIDATPEQCGDAQYQPFKELEDAAPERNRVGIFHG